MQRKKFNNETDDLKDQIRHHRQINWCLAGLSGVLAIGLAYSVLDTRVVVTPPNIQQSFWVEGNKASPQYVEQMALFFLGLMLTVDPGNVEYQTSVVLQHTAPELYSVLKPELDVFAKRVKKDSVAQAFYPGGEARIQGMTARISGRMVRFVGEKLTSNQQKHYQVGFKLQNGKIYVTTFQEMASDGAPAGEPN